MILADRYVPQIGIVVLCFALICVALLCFACFTCFAWGYRCVPTIAFRQIMIFDYNAKRGVKYLRRKT